MKFVRGLAALLTPFLLVAGCAGKLDKPAETLCPSQDFAVFLEKFSADVTTQRLFTNYPLRKMLVVDAQPEPQQQTRLLPKDQIEFPLIPNTNKRAAEGLLLQPKKIEQNSASAILHKPDTDYQVTYIFEKQRCWKLREIQDWSL